MNRLREPLKKRLIAYVERWLLAFGQNMITDLIDTFVAIHLKRNQRVPVYSNWEEQRNWKKNLQNEDIAITKWWWGWTILWIAEKAVTVSVAFDWTQVCSGPLMVHCTDQIPTVKSYADSSEWLFPCLEWWETTQSDPRCSGCDASRCHGNAIGTLGQSTE